MSTPPHPTLTVRSESIERGDMIRLLDSWREVIAVSNDGQYVRIVSTLPGSGKHDTSTVRVGEPRTVRREPYCRMHDIYSCPFAH